MMFDNPCRSAGADRSKLIEPLLLAGRRLCADSPFATLTRHRPPGSANDRSRGEAALRLRSPLGVAPFVRSYPNWSE